MDLALNNLQRLIRHKTRTNKHQVVSTQTLSPSSLTHTYSESGKHMGAQINTSIQ